MRLPEPGRAGLVRGGLRLLGVARSRQRPDQQESMPFWTSITNAISWPGRPTGRVASDASSRTRRGHPARTSMQMKLGQTHEELSHSRGRIFDGDRKPRPSPATSSRHRVPAQSGAARGLRARRRFDLRDIRIGPEAGHVAMSGGGYPVTSLKRLRAPARGAAVEALVAAAVADHDRAAFGAGGGVRLGAEGDLGLADAEVAQGGADAGGAVALPVAVATYGRGVGAGSVEGPLTGGRRGGRGGRGAAALGRVSGRAGFAGAATPR